MQDSRQFCIFRNNNVSVAKGAMYLLKSLAWAGNLPLYRQCILRSGIAEEVQVSILKKCLSLANLVLSLLTDLLELGYY